MPMRFIAALAFVLAASHFSAQAATDLPKRKPGLWELQTTLAEMGGFTHTFQICIDEEFDDLMDTQGDDETDCSENVVRRDGDRVFVDAVCRIDGTTATLRGVFSGDFASRYTGEIKTTYDPPLEGMAETNLTLEGRWLSACRPGQQPGDVVLQGMPNLPGMGDLNLDELMKSLPQMPGR
jgi:hypothetical protein